MIPIEQPRDIAPPWGTFPGQGPWGDLLRTQLRRPPKIVQADPAIIRFLKGDLPGFVRMTDPQTEPPESGCLPDQPHICTETFIINDDGGGDVRFVFDPADYGSIAYIDPPAQLPYQARRVTQSVEEYLKGALGHDVSLRGRVVNLTNPDNPSKTGYMCQVFSLDSAEMHALEVLPAFSGKLETPIPLPDTEAKIIAHSRTTITMSLPKDSDIQVLGAQIDHILDTDGESLVTVSDSLVELGISDPDNGDNEIVQITGRTENQVDVLLNAQNKKNEDTRDRLIPPAALAIAVVLAWALTRRK